MGSNVRQLWQVNKYLWMCLGFSLVYIVAAAKQHLFTAPLWVVWLVFFLAILDGAARSLFGYILGSTLPKGWSWFFTYLDIALIAAAIAISGGIASDLWLFLFVVMIFESLNANPVEKRLMDVNISVAYLAATWPAQHAAATALPEGTYWRLVCSRLFFVILVSALGRRITANSRDRQLELMLLREQMAAAVERARIAREIHDSLGHAMVSSILRLELCARLIAKSPEEAEAMLKEEIPALRAAWNEGRDLAFHLRPWEADVVTEESVANALRKHIGQFAERTGLVVDLREEGAVRKLRPDAAVGLIRIVQEALTNVVKHAQATHVEIVLDYTNSTALRCVIRDDGAGFDKETSRKGVGLESMRERVAALSGTLLITSAPDHGTTLQITLPGF